jgi:predicted RNA-binding Zn-ribbon protein involved in translation (DUF1610 family)
VLGAKERVECDGCGTIIKVRRDAAKPCPACGHRIDIASLVRDEEGVWRHPDAVAVAKTMSRGLAEIAPLLAEHGFELTARGSSKGSGGHFATADFTRGDRAIHLWLRSGLSVRYELGEHTLDHGEYMMALLGSGGGNRFPPYLHDPLEGFRALRFDLERYCGDLLEGSGEEFLRCCREARERRDESGFRRVVRLEHELEEDRD